MGEPDKLCDLADLTVYNKREHGRSKKTEGSKTEALTLEASGLSGIADALPGAKEIEGSIVTEHAGFSGDTFLGGFADGVASHLGLQLGNPFLQSLAYNGTKYLMLEVSQYMFDSLGGFTTGSTMGFSIAQLKEMVKMVLERLETIIDEPSQSCGDFIQEALQAMEDGYPKEAYENFAEAIKNGVKGFNYACSTNKIEMMIGMTRCLIIAEVSRATFDEEKNEFIIGLQNCNDKQGKRIYSVIREPSKYL
eukprot:GFUD01098315.1.p1 GENE.GFUD01098315.1~~GFUD01098315.1.p1  ORF type:complete len:259 (+),score=52.55 GFUD01098315.1:30-779(+)